MIVEIDEHYLDENDDIIDHIRLVVTLLENLHYIKFNDRLFTHFNEMMKKYAGKSGYELFQNSGELLTCTGRLEECLTTIKLSDLDSSEVVTLLLKPSELLVENSANEWPVYERIIKTFQKDSTYGNVVKYINRRKGRHHLVPANAGGNGGIPAIVDLKDNGEYRHLYKKKVCVIFDRDTDDSLTFASSNNGLFKLFAGAGKNSNTIKEEDIYKLDFGDGYIWHMWYKRAIENYFPAEKYKEQGMDISSVPNDPQEYDYYHFVEPKPNKPGCYLKSMVKEMGTGMSLLDYVSTTKSFSIDGGEYSEMLLLILKIAKIV